VAEELRGLVQLESKVRPLKMGKVTRRAKPGQREVGCATARDDKAQASRRATDDRLDQLANLRDVIDKVHIIKNEDDPTGRQEVRELGEEGIGHIADRHIGGPLLQQVRRPSAESGFELPAGRNEVLREPDPV
jgi:hypothetical protein